MTEKNGSPHDVASPPAVGQRLGCPEPECDWISRSFPYPGDFIVAAMMEEEAREHRRTHA